jgi:hypothetical protein
MKKVDYQSLNSKQQESYNFQKLSAVLADYGYTTILLADDYNGADFLAVSMTDGNILKVQLKGRLFFSRKYLGKNLMMAFKDMRDNWYFYPHDELCESVHKINNFQNSEISWVDKGTYSWSRLPANLKTLLEPYKL